ncbi:MAG TPA: tetraacyldisaccharide 4'-kinase [Planctomycetota bacterium]|nr:tetraacyldisaccharide 4'-kinase [Planctomycetota bacterium]
MTLSAGTLDDILSGRRGGFWAWLVRAFLWPVAGAYKQGIALRNRLYDRRLRRVHSLPCTVISVGNLTVGGTGKTPLVETIVRMLHERGVNVAIVSRGYGAPPGKPNDEKLVLAENLPDVPHLSGKDRVACGRTAVDEHQAEVVVVDDGFQHRRLGRDLDIVTIDATTPFGYGYVLPRGLLREPPQSLARADIVVITRSKLVDPDHLVDLEEQVSRFAPQALVVHAVEEVLCFQDLKGNELSPDALKGKSVVAFCGIGNPEAFRQTITDLGVTVAAVFVFDDHQQYTTDHLKAVDRVAADKHAEAILTTQKDRVKIPSEFPWKHDLLVVRIGMRITKGEAAFRRRIDEVTSTEEAAA